MEYLVEWVKNIAVFYIIATLVKNLVPGEKYGKYIKLFLGIVLIVLILKPIGKIVNLEGQYEKLLGDFTYKTMSNELTGQLEMSGQNRQQIIISEYTKGIENEIKEYVDSLGAYCTDCSIEIDLNPESDRYGMISMVRLQVQRAEAYNYRGINVDSIVIDSDTAGEGSFLQVQIKNYMSDVYNLDRRNIYVNILN
ncbi:MAG: stage III sporulation protein AF [Butyrivibrio sp.]